MEQTESDPQPQKSWWRTAIELVGVLTLIGGCLAGAYKFGKEVRDGEASKENATQDSKHSTELIELKGIISEMSIKIALTDSKKSAAESEATRWKAAYDSLLVQLEAEQQSRQELTLALAKSDNCTFIHEQIRSLQTEIRSSTLIWQSPDDKANEKARQDPLELQIQRYQEQLGTCNR